MSRLEEEIMAIDTKLPYSSLIKEKRLAHNSLSDYTSIIIKDAGKGTDIAVSYRKDYLK